MSGEASVRCSAASRRAALALPHAYVHEPCMRSTPLSEPWHSLHPHNRLCVHGLDERDVVALEEDAAWCQLVQPRRGRRPSAGPCATLALFPPSPSSLRSVAVRVPHRSLRSGQATGQLSPT